MVKLDFGEGPYKKVLKDLETVDKGNFDVSSWEADFLENILHHHYGFLTHEQLKSANQIIDKYL